MISQISFLFILLILCFVSLITLYIFYRRQSVNYKKLEIIKNGAENICLKANDALFVINIVSGKIIHSNYSASELLGHPMENLERMNVYDIIPKHLIGRISALIADVWENEGLVFQDIPLVHASGNLIEVECSGKVLPLGEEPTIVIYSRDIRERLKMEREILAQKAEIEQKNKDITDSINYARRIQMGILPHNEVLDECFENYFVLYEPKDIVSGDFYWGLPSINRETNSRLGIIAAVDCTGHGVPGAFMSMLGNTLLNQTINNPEIITAGDVLDYLNRELTENLRSSNKEINFRDGMDMALCIFDFNKMNLNYAGANNPCWIIRENQLIEIKADKHPISASTESKERFNDHFFDLKKDDLVYLFTDGFADQFGGPKGKKFKYKQFKELLLANCKKPIKEQQIILWNAFESWRGNLEQLDDVCVIGIRV